MTEEPLAEFQVTLPPGPYPGLRPFNGDEWPIFFGRERMADDVVTRLVRDQFLVVHGDSGCGKSSLIRAGVLPRLEQENARGGLTWRTTLTQPRNAPLDLMAEALASLDGRAGDDARLIEIRRILNFGADAPRALAELLRRGPSDHICILIDQFEELFAFARHAGANAEARLFVEILVALLEQPPQGLYAVVTMRSEFLGACAHYPGLAEAVNRAQYLLPRMSHADLMRAVCEPATLYGGTVSPELADRLIADSGGSQDQLPLIQHGLMQLWRDATAKANGPAASWRLVLADYRAAGNLSDSLSRHANEILASVEQEPYTISAKVFRALTEINADGQAIRRPQTVAQLAAVASTDTATIIGIVNGFRAEGASLLTPFGSKPIGDQTLIDISHEALIRCWARISAPTAWLAEEFQDGLMWRALLVQANDFDNDFEHQLTLATAEDHERWLQRHCAAWAERYGGGWLQVQYLVRVSITNGQQQLRQKEAAARRRRQYAVAFGVFLVLVAAGLALLNRRANLALARANEASATSLWNRFDFPSPDRLLDDELNALWEVRRAGDDVRAAFFNQLTTLRDRVMRLGRKPAPVLHAFATRLTPEQSSALSEAVLRETAAADDATLFALAPAVQSIAPSLSGEQAASLIDRLSKAAAHPPSTVPSQFGDALAALAGRVDQASAADRLAAVVAGLSASASAETMNGLARAATELANRIPDSRVDGAFGQLLTTIDTSSDPNAIVELTPVATSLAKRLPPGSIPTRLAQLLSTLAQNRPAPEQAVLATLGVQLTARVDDAGSALKAAIDLGLVNNNDADIAAFVSALAAKTPAAEAQAMAMPLVNALSSLKPGERRLTLASTLSAVLPRMNTTKRAQTLDAMIGALATSSNPLDANTLAAGVAAAQPADAMPAERAKQVIAALIAAAHYGDDAVSIEGFVAAGDRASAQLPPANARAAVNAVLAQMSDTVAPGKLRALSALIPGLIGRLTPEDAGALLPQTWQLITHTEDTSRIAGYSLLVPGIARRISAEQARRSLVPCVTFLVGTDDPDQIGALSIAAQNLAALLPADQRAAPLTPAVDKLQVTDLDRLAVLSPIVPSLAPGLNAAQADALMTRLIEAMTNSIYATHLVSLERAASAIATRLATEQVRPHVAVAAQRLNAASDPDRIAALTGTIAALEARRSSEIASLQSLVAWGATTEQTKAALTRLLNSSTLSSQSVEQKLGLAFDLLKYPTVNGGLETTVLGWLRSVDREAPGPEQGIDANLDWAKRSHPSIRVDQAPACPLPLLATLSCPTPTR